jgi:hypothetical protein
VKTSTIVAVLVVLIAIVAAWYALGLPPMQHAHPAPAGVACTLEAMQCPDGSYVGRTGPNCEFVCPTTATAAPATTPPGSGEGQGIAPYHSGIRGMIMAGPTCPVMQNQPQPGCEDKPLATTVTISRAGQSQVFATAKSDVRGAFELSLPPGNYVVSAGENTLPRCNPVSATVGPSSYTSVSVECDTGIR